MNDQEKIGFCTAINNITEQLIILLEALEDNNGIATIDQLYVFFEHRLRKKGYKLTDQDKSVLNNYIHKDAVESGYVCKEGPDWKITSKGTEFLNEIIKDDEDTRDSFTYEDGSTYPYGMPEELDIREEHMTVFEWIRKLKNKMLIIDPEFQRNLVWKPEQKSRFIESVLLNIPLPPLYANQNKEGKYIIVDGLQRTTALSEFMDNRFALEQLEVLNNLNTCNFSKLTDMGLQTRVEDKKMLVYLIKPSVPLAMVYDIFNRINTGGTQLNRQEIRNCIFLGKATRLLKELSEMTCFRRAIDEGISPKRMKDREAVLRFLAFKLFDYENDYKNDMDDFLGEALKKINTMNDQDIKPLKSDFERVMTLTFEFFGNRISDYPQIPLGAELTLLCWNLSAIFFLNKQMIF